MIGRREFLKRSAATSAGVVTCGLASRLGAQPTQPSGSQQQMLTRKIPSTAEPVPAFGMGTWQTFDVDPADEKALAPLGEVLQIFFDGGGHVIDSSPMYGRAEQVTGVLSERLKINDRLFFATKVWTGGEEQGVAQMNRSLERMKRDKLELMQVHNLTDWQTQLKTMREWKEQGRFKYIGITHWQPDRFDDMEQIMRREKVDFVQLPYSIAVRSAEKRLLPAAADTGTAVLVMRPFEGGNLFGKTQGKPLPEFAQGFASSWAQALLKFILAHQAVTCVIPATSKPQHMRDNLQSGYGRLPTEDERKQLIAALGV